MFEKFSDNLNFLMAQRRINANELSRQTGLPASSIKKIRNGDNPNPTLSTLIPLAHFFAINVSQLLGEVALDTINIEQSSLQISQLPIIEWEQAIEWPKPTQIHSSVFSNVSYPATAFALTVDEPQWVNLPLNTILLINPEIQPKALDYVVVYKANSTRPALKQIRIDDEQIYLHPLVQGHEIVRLSEQHKIIGVVTEYKKILRSIA